MLYKDFDTGRERGWLLIKTKQNDGQDKISIAMGIYDRWREKGEENGYVVIRVDVVEDNDFGFDIVVPVDAPKGELGELKEQFKKEEDDIVMDIEHLTVAKHNPALTYLAHGFVSREEFDVATKEHVHPDLHGRIKRKSPGDNPWG